MTQDAKPTEIPDSCPTCRSLDPAKRFCGGGLGPECPHKHDDCTDPWHEEAAVMSEEKRERA